MRLTIRSWEVQLGLGILASLLGLLGYVFFHKLTAVAPPVVQKQSERKIELEPLPEAPKLAPISDRPVRLAALESRPTFLQADQSAPQAPSSPRAKRGSFVQPAMYDELAQADEAPEDEQPEAAEKKTETQTIPPSEGLTPLVPQPPSSEKPVKGAPSVMTAPGERMPRPSPPGRYGDLEQYRLPEAVDVPVPEPANAPQMEEDDRYALPPAIESGPPFSAQTLPPAPSGRNPFDVRLVHPPQAGEEQMPEPPTQPRGDRYAEDRYANDRYSQEPPTSEGDRYALPPTQRYPNYRNQAEMAEPLPATDATPPANQLPVVENPPAEQPRSPNELPPAEALPPAAEPPLPLTQEPSKPEPVPQEPMPEEAKPEAPQPQETLPQAPGEPLPEVTPPTAMNVPEQLPPAEAAELPHEVFPPMEKPQPVEPPVPALPMNEPPIVSVPQKPLPEMPIPEPMIELPQPEVSSEPPAALVNETPREPMPVPPETPSEKPEPLVIRVQPQASPSEPAAVPPRVPERTQPPPEMVRTPKPQPPEPQTFTPPAEASPVVEQPTVAAPPQPMRTPVEQPPVRMATPADRPSPPQQPPYRSVPARPEAPQPDRYAGENRMPQPPQPSQPPQTPDEYEVRPNDTYWGIAEFAYGQGGYHRALRTYNQTHGSVGLLLHVGDRLVIPPAEKLHELYPSLVPQASREYASAGQLYTTRPGDTLFSIAREQLGKASRWVELYRLNRELLGNRVDPLPEGLELRLP